MSEHGSSQSFKAGYRRSRLEPVDPAMLSGPAASPARSASPPSADGSRTPTQDGTGDSDPQKQDTSLLTKVMKVMFIVHNVLFLICSIVAVIIASLLFYIFKNTGQSAKDICDGTAMFLMVNGISCIFFAIWGLQISQKPNRRVTIWYLSTLVFMLILNISCYVKCENLANTVYQAINQYWSTMNTNSRAMLQDFGYCCGYTGPNVMAVQPCPSDATEGCLRSYYDMQGTSKTTSGGFFGFGLLTFITCFVAACRFGFPKDAKSGDVEAGSEAKEGDEGKAVESA